MPLDITFRTLGPWGGGKGANLQPSEVDNNFWSLAQAIISLENDPSMPNGIASINVSGTQMTITLTDGQVMGPYTLPVLTFRWRGDWEPFTSYAVLDVFKIDNVGIFMVIVGYTSSDVFDPQHVDAVQQLFGSVDANLSTLGDVQLTNLQDQDFLWWVAADGKWENVALGDMAFQFSNNVDIIGGLITGMPAPTNPSDVATKGYVDTSIAAGAPSIPPLTMVANIQTFDAAAQPHLLTEFLDAALGSTVVGNIMYRDSAGWTILPPGPAGNILISGGAGVAVHWGTSPAAGVTSISAGVGISTGAGPITSTGAVSLATSPDGYILGNVSGSVAAPTPITLSQFLDHVLTTARGTMVTRTAAGWVGLAPGVAGQYLKTQGPAADLTWDSPAGSGTVISVGAGTGISTGAGPITSSGLVSLAPIGDGRVLANISGSTVEPVPTQVSALFDHVFGTTQGAVLFRSGTGWVLLSPGSNGQVLMSGGPSANPAWANAPTGAPISDKNILANISGASAAAVGQPVSAVLDAVFSSSRGTMLFRGISGWTALAPGTTGQVLTTGGVTSDPSWTAASAGALAGLSDVTLTSPADHDLLEYVASGPRWENKTLSSLLDAVLSSTQGAIAFRGAAGWLALAPGTSGQVLQSGGAGANPSWGAGAGGLPSISDGQLLANISGGGALPVGNTLSAFLDHVLGSTRGSLMMRGASGWTLLGPGSAGQVLSTGGAGADPSWSTVVQALAGMTDVTITSPAANDQLVYVGGKWSNQRPKYNVGCYVPNLLTASQNLLYHRFSKGVTIPANFGSYLGHTSEAGGSVAATASTAITVAKAAAGTPTSFTNVGTITIAAGAVLGAFASSGGTAISFAQGDILRITAPAVADATFADFFATLVGYET